MTKVEVEVPEEELKDLEEFCKHHPEEAKTPGEALRKMAGLKTYRMMKEQTDKEREKPSVQLTPQEMGIPTWIPCALTEQLRALGMSYEDFLHAAIKDVQQVLEGIIRGDKDAQRKLDEWFNKYHFAEIKVVAKVK